MNTMMDQFAILDQMPVGCFVVDAEGTVLFWNRVMAQWTGCAPDDILSHSIYPVFPLLNEQKLITRLSQVFRQGTPIVLSSQLHEQLFPLKQPNGHPRNIQTKVSGLQTEDHAHPYHALFIIQDISDLYENMQKYRAMRDKALTEIEERQRIQERLEYAKDVAEKANQAKTLFMANMSHEIRTPLNAIVGFSTLLKETPMLPSQQEDLNIVVSESRHLMTLIDEILDIARIEAADLALDVSPFDLHASIEDIELSARLRAGEKDLSLAVHVDPAVPRIIMGDEFRLRQIIQNLLNNAIKFTQQGSVKLDVYVNNECDERPVTRDECFLLFKVTDTGVGLAPEDSSLIFDEFVQADSSSTRQYGGVGLGLAIAKRLVSLMGGRIWVESELNKGSVFTFTMLAKVPDKMPYSVSSQDEPDENELSFPGCVHLHILLAEDDETNQRLLNAYLSRSSHKLKIVSTGEDAVNEWKEGSYDLILMDLQMPLMDGLEATRLIRQSESEQGRGEHIPIIAITAHAMKGDHERCLQAGTDAYITKPVSKSTLEYAIGEVIARRWASATHPST